MAAAAQPTGGRPGPGKDVQDSRHETSDELLGVPSMSPRKDLSDTLQAMQQRLGSARGKTYWRTLDELADSAAFQEVMRQEFPEQADVWPDRLSRRQFLALMGASLALAGLTGCSVRPAPARNIVPYVRQPEEIVPGRPLFYATAMTLGGTGVGLLVENHLGRPTKVEGNPDHPASLGASDIFHQASILTLYDPDRAQTVMHLGQPRTWDDALAALRQAMEQQRTRRGAGLRLLTETVVSATLGGQIQQLTEAFPDAKWHQYEPLARDNAYRGAVQAFGEYANTYYRFHDLGRNERTADVVLSLDADFLNSGPGSLCYTAAVEVQPTGQAASLRELAEEMERGCVEALIILGANPVFTAPADLRFQERMQRVPLRVCLSLEQDETARQCHWHLPETHYL